MNITRIERIDGKVVIIDTGVPDVPQELSRQKFKLALVHEGVNISMIENMINGLEEPNKTIVSILWNDSATFERNNQTLIQFAEQLGLSEEQLDHLFILGDTL